jgi:catechol 2,3-dioxygenase-like lactoylglutathione lyase family enzyme
MPRLEKLTPNLIVADVERSLAFYRDRGRRHPDVLRCAEGPRAGVLPLEKKWYGVTEFAFLDPDGDIITFAQPESGA